jgi:hypothetical protein
MRVVAVSLFIVEFTRGVCGPVLELYFECSVGVCHGAVKKNNTKKIKMI